MAKKKEAASSIGHYWREYAALALVMCAVLVVIALLTYDADDILSTRVAYHNAIGIVGAYVSYALFLTCGVAAYVFPLFLVALALMIFYHVAFPPIKYLGARTFTIVVLIICGASLAHIAHPHPVEYLSIPGAGGIIGALLNEYLFERYLGTTGSIVLLTGIAVIAILFLLNMSVRSLGEGIRLLSQLFSWCAHTLIRILHATLRALHTAFVWCHMEIRVTTGRIMRLFRRRATPKPVIVVTRPRPPRKKATTAPDSGYEEEEEIPVATRVPQKDPEPTAAPVASADDEEEMPPYEMPPLDLLDEPQIEDTDEIEIAASNAAIRLAKTLEDFGIDAQMGQSTCGPVITCHEVHPAPGVKVRSITNIENELAMAMKAKSIRIIAPIPGKDAVGIELPNAVRRTVTFSEVINSDDFDSAARKMQIPFAIGQTLSGEIFVDDIADMPHLLIAGATGSGKSVCINTLLMSLLMRFDVDTLRLVLVDPKHVELVPYKDIPHLLVPVLNEPSRVPLALDWLIAEMERRYKFFARFGVRNITMYNEKRAHATEPMSIRVGAHEYDLPLFLPYIVLVIDELADLMMVAADEIEKKIIRLAQLARAAGIHMIIATQRPSANVITGLIKANIPARIGFRTTSGVDSKVIIDETGTQKLLGKGDMLYKAPSMTRTMRVQGAYVSEEEVRRVTQFIREQRRPNYVDLGEVQAEANGVEIEMDDKFDEAIVTVLESGQASASYLQRRLQVGYARAARLVDLMEAHGIVGPKRGAKPREILVDEWPPATSDDMYE